MQPMQFAVLNFALALLGLWHQVAKFSASEDRVLQWVRLEARLARDGDQPELLRVAREHRLAYQQPVSPFYVTYALIYALMMLVRLMSRTQFDGTLFLRDISGGALYALVGAALLMALNYWTNAAFLTPATWFCACLTLALVLSSPLDGLQARQAQRDAAAQQQ